MTNDMLIFINFGMFHQHPTNDVFTYSCKLTHRHPNLFRYPNTSKVKSGKPSHLDFHCFQMYVQIYQISEITWLDLSLMWKVLKEINKTASFVHLIYISIYIYIYIYLLFKQAGSFNCYSFTVLMLYTLSYKGHFMIVKLGCISTNIWFTEP